jgi:hypothetical protein
MLLAFDPWLIPAPTDPLSPSGKFSNQSISRSYAHITLALGWSSSWFWAEFKRLLGDYDKVPTGMLEMWDRVQAIWDGFGPDCWQKLIESMPRRMAMVLGRKRKYIRYWMVILLGTWLIVLKPLIRTLQFVLLISPLFVNQMCSIDIDYVTRPR